MKFNEAVERAVELGGADICSSSMDHITIGGEGSSESKDGEWFVVLDGIPLKCIPLGTIFSGCLCVSDYDLGITGLYQIVVYKQFRYKVLDIKTHKVFGSSKTIIFNFNPIKDKKDVDAFRESKSAKV